MVRLEAARIREVALGVPSTLKETLPLESRANRESIGCTLACATNEEALVPAPEKTPPTYNRPKLSGANQSPILLSPEPSVDQAAPSQRAMPAALTPPAVVKEPQAYRFRPGSMARL